MKVLRRPRFRPALEALENRVVPSRFEVWAIDQSNTRDENGNGSVLDSVDGGGTLYIYRGSQLAGKHAADAVPEVIDLGGAARDLSVAQTGTAPTRPHMFMFNHTGSHAVIAYVSTGHVLFMDAAHRTPVAAIDVGVQAHAATPAPDDSFVIVANQNGKKLHRIWTNYDTNTFTLDPVALDLAVGTTPSGAPRQDPVLRPDNAPICPIIDSSSRFAFVTLRGGGLFVVDTRGPELQIVNEYDRDTIHHDGCGGLEANGKMYINSGGPGEADLYAFKLRDFDRRPDPPNTPAPKLVFSQDGDPTQVQVDSHGATLTRHGDFLWVADRWANKIVVVDVKKDRVVNEVPLAGKVSSDPAPDLLATSPDGSRVYAALRGPRPLTANNPTFNNAVGATPGVGVIQVRKGGRDGKLIAIAPITNMVDGLERADPHSVAVREIHGRGGKEGHEREDCDETHAVNGSRTVGRAAAAVLSAAPASTISPAPVALPLNPTAMDGVFANPWVPGVLADDEDLDLLLSRNGSLADRSPDFWRLTSERGDGLTAWTGV